jgi:hypothetical protein
MFVPLFKIPTIPAALLVAGLLGMACNNSGLKISAHDDGAASGGQAGSTISSGTTGGTGGTIGSGGVGGASIGDTGSTNSPGGVYATILPMCNQGDTDLSLLGLPPMCPVGVGCYSLQAGCNTVLCMLPEGVHCSDLLSCNPGDIWIPGWDSDCDEHTNSCYTKRLCTQSIVCRYVADAGVDVSTLDADVDEGTIPRCGDGILEPGEQCDMGSLNGLVLDASGNPTDAGGCPFCSTDCTILLCVF